MIEELGEMPEIVLVAYEREWEFRIDPPIRTTHPYTKGAELLMDRVQLRIVEYPGDKESRLFVRASGPRIYRNGSRTAHRFDAYGPKASALEAAVIAAAIGARLITPEEASRV